MKLLLYILLAVAILPQDIPDAWEKACNKAVNKVFKGEDIRLEVIQLTPEPGRLKYPGIVLYELYSSEELAGYAVLTSAKGRYDYFDYMVIYENDLRIKKVQVFEYRSDHGYEICSKKWLRQFEGRNACDFQYGSDIDAISGATYSASSITEDINKLCELLKRHLE